MCCGRAALRDQESWLKYRFLGGRQKQGPVAEKAILGHTWYGASFEGSLNVGVWHQVKEIKLLWRVTPFFLGFIFAQCEDKEEPKPIVLEVVDCSFQDPCLSLGTSWFRVWAHGFGHDVSTYTWVKLLHDHDILTVTSLSQLLFVRQLCLWHKYLARSTQVYAQSLFGEHCRACRFMEPCNLMWQMLWRCTKLEGKTMLMPNWVMLTARIGHDLTVTNSRWLRKSISMWYGL